MRMQIKRYGTNQSTSKAHSCTLVDCTIQGFTPRRSPSTPTLDFDDWKHVAWSDKSRFQLNRADGHVRIVRVQYFVRGGFVRHCSRASSKHLSPHLPVDELDSSGGGQTGVALHLQMHVWVSDPQRKPTRC
ncbi:hypothetical protein TNCV_1511941 [Trichonephila clavipes]|nr:hypothetical protein TNCV_1511941 [Trichonephila clavipes]